MSGIAYFTRFMPSPQRGGGSRRTIQIINLIRKSTVKIISAPRGDGLEAGRLAKIEEVARNLDINNDTSSHDLILWSPQRRRGVFRLREIADAWNENSHLLEDVSLALVDDPVYFPPLMETLQKKEIPIIAICHNIESLSRGQVSEESTIPLLKKEVDLLKSASLVVTISREENWLLNNLGLKSYFYPYFPVDAIKERMIEIRRQRILSDKSGYLVMGTAHNIQTRMGMQQLIQYWTDNDMSQEFGLLRIAGFATESFIPAPRPGSGIELLGSLEDRELDSILTQTKACVCYQESGSGALTRIPELLLANVPVVANTLAARSYSDKPGVIEFQSLEELPKVLKVTQNNECEIPTLNPPAEHSFLGKFSELLPNN